MKRKIAFFLIIMAFAGLCIYNLCYDDIEKSVNKKDIEDHYAIDLKGAEIISYDDTHGGFFGDGERFVVFDVSEWDKKEEVTAKWEGLPLTENLELIMYGGKKDEMTYGFNFAEKNGIPAIIDGKYFFYDRLHENYSDRDLFSGASFNFTVFMYDNNTHKLYMLEVDT